MKKDMELNAFIHMIKDISRQNEKDINHDNQKLKDNLIKNYYK